MVTKRVMIEFANPTIRAIDCIGDIRRAAESAGLNLYSRHRVQLQYPMPVNGKVVVEIKIPNDIASTFAIGNHMRGISKNLLGNKGRYDKYLVGNRLLNYIVLEGDSSEPASHSMAERFDAIVAFAELLKKSDAVSLDRIDRIVNILSEE